MFALDVNWCFQIMSRSCACVKNPSDRSPTAACDFSQSIWHGYAQGVSLTLHLQEAYTSRAKQGINEGAIFPLSDLSFKLRFVSYSAWSSLTVDAVNGWMGGRAGGRQHHSRSSLHQHPQTDHVRTHVPEIAEGCHRPGWALRWRAETACGLNGMRQTWGATVPLIIRTRTENCGERDG